MKRFLLGLLTALFVTAPAMAQQQVTSVWAFNIANAQGSYYRALLEESNTLQKKYNFVADHKPGAGGAIGAGHVKNQKDLALLGTAAAYFVRPYLYSNNSYTFDDFRPVHIMALAPAALVVKPGNSLEAILKKDKIVLGTAGPGSLTHLMALKFKENFPKKEVVLTPYKSSTEALADVLGGHTDATFEYIGDAEAKGAQVIGTTGAEKVKNYPMLKDMGYPNQENLVGVYMILVKKDTPTEVVEELRNTFVAAEAKSKRFQELYASDYSAKPRGVKTEAEYQAWYKKTVEYYKGLTAGQQVQ